MTERTTLDHPRAAAAIEALRRIGQTALPCRACRVGRARALVTTGRSSLWLCDPCRGRWRAGSDVDRRRMLLDAVQ